MQGKAKESVGVCEVGVNSVKKGNRSGIKERRLVPSSIASVRLFVLTLAL